MRCQQCGAENNATAQFCHLCGQRLARAVDATGDPVSPKRWPASVTISLAALLGIAVGLSGFVYWQHGAAQNRIVPGHTPEQTKATPVAPPQPSSAPTTPPEAQSASPAETSPAAKPETEAKVSRPKQPTRTPSIEHQNLAAEAEVNDPPAPQPQGQQEPARQQEPSRPIESQPPAAPPLSPAAPAAPVHPKYDGPESGVVVWKGKLEKNETLTLDEGIPSTGVLSGAQLPGVPVRLSINETNLGFAELPNALNGYRRLILKSHGKHDRITVHWYVQ